LRLRIAIAKMFGGIRNMYMYMNMNMAYGYV
jgi:hypothetical protein